MTTGTTRKIIISVTQDQTEKREADPPWVAELRTVQLAVDESYVHR